VDIPALRVAHLRQVVFAQCPKLCSFADPPSAQWRATELWIGKPERSYVEPVRLLVPEQLSRTIEDLYDRRRAGFWRRSCASSEI
jgi:hypothetical protein